MEIDFRPTFNLDNPDVPIWRYLTIDKLKDLLETKSLYFRRMDKFIDEFEGHMNAHTAQILDRMFVGEYENHQEMSESLKTALKNLKAITFVNCWHISGQESKQMWEEYTAASSGVVIKTTARRLMASILETHIGALHMQKVEYLDTVDQDIDLSHMLRLLNTKQKQYEFEQELRVVLIYTEGELDQADGETVIMDTPEKGLKLDVDLNTLIEKIYIHPKATKTDYKLLRVIVMKLSGKWLKRSRLNHLSIKQCFQLCFQRLFKKKAG